MLLKKYMLLERMSQLEHVLWVDWFRKKLYVYSQKEVLLVYFLEESIKHWFKYLISIQSYLNSIFFLNRNIWSQQIFSNIIEFLHQFSVSCSNSFLIKLFKLFLSCYRCVCVGLISICLLSITELTNSSSAYLLHSFLKSFFTSLNENFFNFAGLMKFSCWTYENSSILCEMC